MRMCLCCQRTSLCLPFRELVRPLIYAYSLCPNLHTALYLHRNTGVRCEPSSSQKLWLSTLGSEEKKRRVERKASGSNEEPKPKVKKD